MLGQAGHFTDVCRIHTWSRWYINGMEETTKRGEHTMKTQWMRAAGSHDCRLLTAWQPSLQNKIAIKNSNAAAIFLFRKKSGGEAIMGKKIYWCLHCLILSLLQFPIQCNGFQSSSDALYCEFLECAQVSAVLGEHNSPAFFCLCHYF